MHKGGQFHEFGNAGQCKTLDRPILFTSEQVSACDIRLYIQDV